jgi:Holliday junction DNA helicase RuvB
LSSLAQTVRSQAIEGKHVEESSAQLGIDARGLWPDEQKILELLTSHHRPMGLEALSLNLGIDPDTIRFVHEPFLVKRGYIVRMQRGREATLKAHRDYGLGMAESA